MEIVLKVPTNINDIKLSQYQKFLSISKDQEESEFLTHKMISIFCEVDLQYVSKFKYKDVQEIAQQISSLFTKDNKLTTRFEYNGIDYGFIPNLEEITSGEYMDLDTYIVDWDNMHRCMSVLFRPIKNKLKDKYTIEPYVGSNETMKDMPLGYVLGAVVFFYNLGNDLLSSTLNYLEKDKEVQNILKQHNLENVGDGIHLSMLSLKEMLEDSMKFQDLEYINA